MGLYRPWVRKCGGILLLGWIASISFFGLFARVRSASATAQPGVMTEAAAQAARGVCLKTGIVPSVCPVEGIAEAQKTVNEKLISPTISTVLLTAFLNLSSYFTNRLAYEAAVWVGSGGKGQTPLFNSDTAVDAWKNFGLDTAGEFVGQLNNYTEAKWGSQFNLCKPTDIVSFSLSLGVKQAYKPSGPSKCNLRAWGEGYESFKRSLAEFSKDPTGEMMKEFATYLTPGRNELGIAVSVNNKLYDKISKEQAAYFANYIGAQGYKPVTDLVTGRVTTPASIVEQKLYNDAIQSSDKISKEQQEAIINNTDLGWQLLISFGLSTFTNTLASTLFERVRTGLFAPQPPRSDPFSNEATRSGGVAEIQQRFSSLLAVTPIGTSNYNAISEFVVCPVGNILTRGLNNCVMDANFAAAVSRTSGGVTMTVQEAVKEGLLRGDWPLIPPTDKARNQDPLCYTYGFCYGNLVKLRKARIIPIGWELAAQKNSVSSPATLQQIMDGFESCNERGQADETHKWCHLIDPNWVLKYPETQCRATVNGETLATIAAGGRASVCVDTPSCVAENPDRTCKGAYGYCVREKNVWRFRGDACPEQFVSCLNFRDTFTNKTASWLLNTVDYGICNGDNAGCRWYDVNKTFDDKGTTSDKTDDTYEWLKGGTTYTVAVEDAKKGERIYLNNNAVQCSAAEAGCTRLYSASASVRLNMLGNPGFEGDNDRNNQPDFWQGTFDAASTGNAYEGAKSVKNPSLTQDRILLSPYSFYTVSVYAKSDATGTASGSVELTFTDAITGVFPNLTNRSTSCQPGADSKRTLAISTTSGTYQRFSCTFSTADRPLLAHVELKGSELRMDAVELEVGEKATDYVSGYSSVPAVPSYLHLPPAYLNCTGTANDPKECADYAQVCAAQDVGCNRYTPTDGGPAIPATISEIDRCPAECVGYTTYKQEATPYEPEVFPLHFIASKAVSCSAQYVGCDSFTNLDAVARGGEGVEHYTALRACTTPPAASANNKTYFTWEGSDVQGYQLKTWQLLKSNSTTAPCTNWRLTGTDANPTLVCDDSEAAHVAELAADTACNDHDDIFREPDCREFYDDAGQIWYRRYADTVSVSVECHPYRKTQATKTQCDKTGGFWTAAGECRYFGLASESAICPASADGCREYTGGAGRNASTVASDDFENTTTITYYTPFRASVSQSNESTSTGGHSMRIVSTVDGGGIEPAIGDKVVKGKTFILSFWAKGSGPIRVTFKDTNGNIHDWVDPSNVPANDSGAKMLDLSGGWKPYTLGPLDTSKAEYGTFGMNTKFRVTASAGTTFYFDNFRLTQTEENITLIKNSWVVPSTCDLAPNGTASPQYYLGCQAYTDKDGKGESLYQFTRLCSEKVIGCKQFFTTQNSNVSTGAAYNLRCERFPNVPTGGNTPCKINGVTYCTISAGRSYCIFDLPNPDLKMSLPKRLPFNAAFSVKLGPEVVIVPNDTAMYVVDDGTKSCTNASVGCKEIGVPKFSRDKKTVESFASAYYMDAPDTYDQTLCENEELFCEEWATTKDGNYYFKDPLDQQCEYKTNVKIGTRVYYGWFRKDASSPEPCYWTDKDGDKTYDAGEETFVVGSEQFGVWKNGDTAFAGWAGACESGNDRCTAFIDPTDTKEGLLPAGTQYSFINNDLLSERNQQGSAACNGEVSQKLGCVLFNNTNILNLTYAAGPSYVASTHANTLFGEARFSLQSPIDCSKDSEVTQPNGTKVDLCNRRCKYTIGATNKLVSGEGVKIAGDAENVYVGACLTDQDCAPQKAGDAQTYTGKCVEDARVRHANDVNSVLKVNRDRECAEWLACGSSRASWNTQTNKYEEICDAIDLCTKNGSGGACAQWKRRDAVKLTENFYSSRDVSWNGLDYTGYSIPNVLPVEQLDQVNIADPRAEPNYALAYVAGACAQADEGKECRVGVCRETGDSCSKNLDCRDVPSTSSNPSGANPCVIGYCQVVSNKTCSTDADCSTTPSTSKCDLGRCVDRVLPDPAATACTSDAQCGVGTCQLIATTKIGSCRNALCLTDIEGRKFSRENGVEKSCRGYPEVDSPFPSKKVVEKWRNPTESAGSGHNPPTKKDDIPMTYKQGYQTTKIFSPLAQEGGGVSISEKSIDGCGYQKQTYGDGGELRYYPPANGSTFNLSKGLTSICIGGAFAGKECTADTHCGSSPTRPGTCAKLSKTEMLYGWPGYCLEKDSSTQIYGSDAVEDRACLTWIPVDQLRGSTDLFGKFTEAGFKAEDVFYCGDIDVAYDLPTSSVACIEGNETLSDYKADCDASTSDPGPWYDKNTLVQLLKCPKDHFAIITSCTDNNKRPRNPNGGEYCTDSGSDDDFPYFCVPELAFLTPSDINQSSATACYPPQANYGPDLVQTEPRANEAKKLKKDALDGTPMYVVAPDKFEDIRAYYAPCTRFGVSRDTFRSMKYGDIGSIASLNDTSTEGTIAEFSVNVSPYLMCNDLVQTASAQLMKSGALSYYNQAWTDRIQDNAFSIQSTSSPPLQYKSGTKGIPPGDPIFGRSLTYDGYKQLVFSSVARPVSIVACKDGNNYVPADGGLENVCTVPANAAPYSNQYLGRSYENVALRCSAGSTQGGATVPDCFMDADMDTRQWILSCPNLRGDTSAVQITASALIGGGSVGSTWVESAPTTTLNVKPSSGSGFCEIQYLFSPSPDAFQVDCNQVSATHLCVQDKEVNTARRTCVGIGGAVIGDSCSNLNNVAEAVPGEANVRQGAADRLGQIFASVMNRFGWWSDFEITNNPDTWQNFYSPQGLTIINNLAYDFGIAPETDDVRYPHCQGRGCYSVGVTNDTPALVFDRYLYEGNRSTKPTQPVVLSVGEGTNGLYQEKKSGTFSVNDQDEGIVTGRDGQRRATVSFFTYANKNQMPIRKVIVDWGDARDYEDKKMLWSTSRQSGSDSPDNFYKNHRGSDQDKKPICGTDADGWGTDPQACDSSFTSFIHDYTCAKDEPGVFRACIVENGRLVNSPCTGGGVPEGAKKCVFQPRVHVMDNWGWCTGTCKGGSPDISADKTDGCFDGTQINVNQYKNECDVTQCPGDSKCQNENVSQGSSNIGNTLVNPWVNFKGYVIVEPPGYKP